MIYKYLFLNKETSNYYADELVRIADAVRTEMQGLYEEFITGNPLPDAKELDARLLLRLVFTFGW